VPQIEDIHDESRAWRVVDDLARDQPVDPAELDAAEAFLMPVVNAIIKNAGGSRRPQTSSFCQQIQTDVSRKSELAWSNTGRSPPQNGLLPALLRVARLLESRLRRAVFASHCNELFNNNWIPNNTTLK